jgi:flavin-dependent dehydrogenase
VGRANHSRVDYSLAAAGQRPYAYNFDRARFDTLLLEQATHKGVRVVQDADVKRVLCTGARVCGVQYHHAGRQREARARFVVDASGRAGLLARHFALRRMNPRLQNVAVFQQYTELIEAHNPSQPGDLVLVSHEEGWLWGIPIDADVLSVGAVMPAARLKGHQPQQMFAQHLQRSQRLSERVRGARPVFSQVRTASDFCYHAERLAGPGFFLVGDAGCFVDPMFSGGLFFTLVTGMQTAATIADILQGAPEAEAQAHYEAFAKTGYDAYFRLVYDFYETMGGNVTRLLNHYPCELAFVVQTLFGDFWGRPDQPLLQHLRARPELDTFTEPFAIVHTCPIYAEACYRLEDDFTTLLVA